MLILRVLRLLGFDFSARIASARAAVEQRIAHTRDEAIGVARRVAITIVLAALAAIVAIALVGVGLAALYIRVSASMGVYAGLGAVAGVLGFILLVVIIALAVRGSNTGRPAVRSPSQERAAAPKRAAADTPRSTTAATGQPGAARSDATTSVPEDASAAKPSPDELLAHFGTLIGTHFMSSSIHPALAEGLRYLQTAQVSRDIAAGADPLDAAASVVRDGDRKAMLAVLAGAGVLGWMAARLPRD